MGTGIQQGDLPILSAYTGTDVTNTLHRKNSGDVSEKNAGEGTGWPRGKERAMQVFDRSNRIT